MPYMPVDGTRIYYEEKGSPDGRPLLLLHASLQTAESMEPLVKLAEPLGYRIVVPDQRGHGRSANAAPGFTLARLADDMEALMRGLGLERPVVAGFSLGGTVGVELARRGRLSRLVVLAGRVRPGARGRERFAPEGIRQRSPRWAEQLAVSHVETPWELLAEQIGELFGAWPGFSADDLAGITCATLVVQGDRDDMVPPEQGEYLAEHVPGARLVVVPRAGHPELLYRADGMRAVADFLR